MFAGLALGWVISAASRPAPETWISIALVGRGIAAYAPGLSVVVVAGTGDRSCAWCRRAAPWACASPLAMVGGASLSGCCYLTNLIAVA